MTGPAAGAGPAAGTGPGDAGPGDADEPRQSGHRSRWGRIGLTRRRVGRLRRLFRPVPALIISTAIIAFTTAVVTTLVDIRVKPWFSGEPTCSPPAPPRRPHRPPTTDPASSPRSPAGSGRPVLRPAGRPDRWPAGWPTPHRIRGALRRRSGRVSPRQPGCGVPDLDRARRADRHPRRADPDHGHPGGGDGAATQPRRHPDPDLPAPVTGRRSRSPSIWTGRSRNCSTRPANPSSTGTTSTPAAPNGRRRHAVHRRAPQLPMAARRRSGGRRRVDRHDLSGRPWSAPHRCREPPTDASTITGPATRYGVTYRDNYPANPGFHVVTGGPPAGGC